MNNQFTSNFGFNFSTIYDNNFTNEPQYSLPVSSTFSGSIDMNSLDSSPTHRSSSRSSSRNSPNNTDFDLDLLSFDFRNLTKQRNVQPIQMKTSTNYQPNPVGSLSAHTKYYCETVAVESSAHVAQIVGKNGCKIKHLREKFGTYIHTPANNEEPVFVIKGIRRNVFLVKQEIIHAANHFTKIKDERMQKISNIINSDNCNCLKLFMPPKYIGLVVGRNGWFVKKLQMKFNIYIETPKFDLCNYFRLYGVKENLEQVKCMIYDHILKKTGITLTEVLENEQIYFVD